MGRFKSILGYTSAVLAFLVIPATFIGLNYFSSKLVSVTGIKVSPRFTGGEVIKTVDHNTYKTLIHRPVFDGLIGERQNGFIQINWERQNNWPQIIEEKIDYNRDNLEDFFISIETKTGKATLTAYNPSVVGIGQTYVLKSGCAARILLKKQ
ncbi:MAG: hypothetical protein NT010_03410 [Proteobacteria bacterium]|nr:hypothetical protein [Pseudomonadota bacterium]